MVVGSDPPAGGTRWTLRVQADQIGELGSVDSISHVTVGELLKNEIKPWRITSWCIGKPSETYGTAMEDVLDVDQRPYDPKRPVICLDVTSKELHDPSVAGCCWRRVRHCGGTTTINGTGAPIAFWSSNSCGDGA